MIQYLKNLSLGARIAIGIIVLGVAYVAVFPISQTVDMPKLARVPGAKTAMFANGCFWCVEADFEKLAGVLDAVSGYADGEGSNPTYEDYGERGFREVVEVTYDPAVVSYAQLVEYMIKHGDPTDGQGSFYDRGYEYSPGVYFDTEEERVAAQAVVARIDSLEVFSKPLALTVTKRGVFWPAEEYHQDYYKNNPIRYAYYRKGSGRDAFIKKHWGANTHLSSTQASGDGAMWRNFVKSPDDVLRAKLTPLQYEVTQHEGTEEPFDNAYNSNAAEGIYVDVVSGEPLFSSRDKFDSGTGWPSFVKPLSAETVVLKEDRQLFVVRTEVRSRYGDSHLGHVFNDGPSDRGGLRYCMNSAALRFVPKNQLQAEGYGEFVSLFN